MMIVEDIHWTTFVDKLIMRTKSKELLFQLRFIFLSFSYYGSLLFSMF
jgi:hypothetical protein